MSSRGHMVEILWQAGKPAKTTKQSILMICLCIMVKALAKKHYVLMANLLTWLVSGAKICVVPDTTFIHVEMRMPMLLP